MKNTIIAFTLVLLCVSCVVETNKPEVKELADTSGVTPSTDDTIQNFDQEIFEAKRQLWLGQNLQNYFFHIEYFGYGFGAWAAAVTVKNGVLDSFAFDKEDINGYPYSYCGDDFDYYPEASEFIVPIAAIYDSITRIRDWVEDPLKRAERQHPAFTYHYSLEVEYDNEYHFPKYFSDYRSFNYKKETHPDDRLLGNMALYSITITNFAVNP